MTVIAYRDGIMAADTGHWFGDICVGWGPKVWLTEYGELVAACGDTPQIEQFKDWLDAAAPDDERPFQAEPRDFGALLVRPGIGRGLVHVDHLLRFYRPAADFAVEGCHQEFMLALMLAGYSAVDCVAMAIKHCSHASGEVYSLKLGETDA